MLHLDTSVLVPLVVPEALSDRVERWFAAAGTGNLATSRWSSVEFASAVGNKVRRQELDEPAGAAAIDVLTRRVAPALRLVAVEDEDFAAAVLHVGRFGLGLRGGDALHLAVRRRIGAAPPRHAEPPLRRGRPRDRARDRRAVCAALMAAAH